jgi:arylformamidase
MEWAIVRWRTGKPALPPARRRHSRHPRGAAADAASRHEHYLGMQLERGVWMDVTVPIRHEMVHWPGNPPVELVRTADVAKGDPATLSHLSLGVHTGTHVDAPVHFLAEGSGIDTVPLEALVGEVRVLPIRDPRSIGAAELRTFDPREGERLLFKTQNSSRRWGTTPFLADFVFLSLEGARFLADRRARTVGIDYLSVAGMHESTPTHVTLMRADVCIIEGLDLSAVEPGAYDMICLPLLIPGADGAPARVLLRRR